MILEAALKGLLPSDSPGPGPSSEAADCTQTLKWWMFTCLYYSVGLRSMESNLTHTSRNLLEPSQGQILTGNSSRWISFSVRIFTCSPRYQADPLTVILHWIRLFQMPIWSSHSSAANISMTSYCSLKKKHKKQSMTWKISWSNSTYFATSFTTHPCSETPLSFTCPWLCLE